MSNNKYVCNARQGVSNANEAVHAEILMWTSFMQICGILCWVFYLNLFELKHDQLCVKYMVKNREKYPNISDDYINQLLSYFDYVIEFKDIFYNADKYGYQEIKIKPFKQKPYEHYYDLGIIEEPKWKYSDDQLILRFVMNDLKIFENPDLKLDSSMVHRCWNKYFKPNFSVDIIANKLRVKFFRFSSLFCVSSPCLL